MNADLFVIRRGQLNDASAISALEQQCALESQSFRGSNQLLATAPFIGNEFEKALEDADQLVLVVESSGEICGFADMAFSDSVAMVRRVYISESARELGAGAALIDELRMRFKSRLRHNKKNGPQGPFFV